MPGDCLKEKLILLWDSTPLFLLIVFYKITIPCWRTYFSTVEAMFPEALWPVLKEFPMYTAMLWMFGRDVSLNEFVCFDWLLNNHFPAQNTLKKLLVDSQSVYERETHRCIDFSWQRSSVWTCCKQESIWRVGMTNQWLTAVERQHCSVCRSDLPRKLSHSCSCQTELTLLLSRERTEQRPQSHLAESIN